MCDEKSSFFVPETIELPYRSPVKGEDEEIKDGGGGGGVVYGQVGQAHSQPELPACGRELISPRGKLCNVVGGELNFKLLIRNLNLIFKYIEH